MIISELEIRSYKSFGNNPQIVKMNTQGGELVLLAGINGSGKSLVLSTEIDIEIDIATLSDEDRMIFLETMGKKRCENISLITLDKLQKLQNKISLIDKYDVNVKTPNGYKKIKAIGITSPNSKKIQIKTLDFNQQPSTKNQ